MHIDHQGTAGTAAGFTLRAAAHADAAAMLHLLRSVSAEGDTLPFDEPFDAAMIEEVWLAAAGCTLAVDQHDGSLLGMHRFGRNMPGRAAHIASATYVVARAARGRGIGRALVADTLARAAAAGFHGMQFNLVVASNTAAIALYESLGFVVTGRTPGGFRHAQTGLVDTLIMFRPLATSMPVDASGSGDVIQPLAT